MPEKKEEKTTEPELREIELRLIKTNPFQPRKTAPPDDEIAELMESIRAVGVRTPIRVRPMPGKDEYQIADGAMRVVCQRKLGKKTILAVVEPLTDRQMKILALSQNVFVKLRDSDKEGAVYRLWESEYKSDGEGKPGVRRDATYSGLREMAQETGINSGTITRYLQSYETRNRLSEDAKKEDQAAIKRASSHELADLSKVAKDAPAVAREIVLARTEEAVKGVPLIRASDVREMAKAVEQAKTADDKQRVADDLLAIRRQAFKEMTKAVTPKLQEMDEKIKGVTETPAAREDRIRESQKRADSKMREEEERRSQELVRSRAQVEQRQLVTFTRILAEARSNTGDDSYRRVTEVVDAAVGRKTVETIRAIADAWKKFADRFKDGA